jgi:hypothetical protein
MCTAQSAKFSSQRLGRLLFKKGTYFVFSINQIRKQTNASFSLPQSSKFFHSLSITSIFNRLHGVLNVGKKK